MPDTNQQADPASTNGAPDKNLAPKRRRRRPIPKMNSLAHPARKAAAFFDDAANVIRKLKRKYHDSYQQDREEFKCVIKKALARVCRLKPGPKYDIRIVKAGDERAAGAKWQALFPKYIDWYEQMPESTRILAEEGFRRKVNGYICKTPRLKARKKSVQKLKPQLPAA